MPDQCKDFEDIWKIHQLENKIIFQCFKYIFLLQDSVIDIVKPQKQFHFSFCLGNRFFVQEPEIGLFELINGKLEMLDFWRNHRFEKIASLTEYKDGELLIGTSTNGFYVSDGKMLRKWDTPANEFVNQNSLYYGLKLSDNRYAFGTILQGAIISDQEGNIIQTINTKNGIQNNTVLSLCADKNENLWLGLDNGVAFVEQKSPFGLLADEQLGTGYCSYIFDSCPYVGTNQGLFCRSIKTANKNLKFNLVKNSSGQVWSYLLQT